MGCQAAETRRYMVSHRLVGAAHQLEQVWLQPALGTLKIKHTKKVQHLLMVPCNVCICSRPRLHTAKEVLHIRHASACLPACKDRETQRGKCTRGPSHILTALW